MRQRPTIPLWMSLYVAGRGFVEAVREQRNLRIHCVCAVAVGLLAAWLRLPVESWRWLSLAVALVIAVELLNTALETVVDYVSLAEHELARKAKDISAAGVLVMSVLAVVIGLTVFIPPLLARWQSGL